MVSRQDLSEAIKSVRGWARGIVRIASVGSVSSDGKVQTAKSEAMDGQSDAGVEIFEQYGLTSAPPGGSEGIALKVGGSRDHTVLVCIGNRASRPPLVGNEVKLYHLSGSSITLRDDGSIEVTPAEGQTVKLGGPGAALAAARVSDTLTAAAELAAWAATVDANIIALAAASVPPIPGMQNIPAVGGLTGPGTLGTIATGAAKVTAE